MRVVVAIMLVGCLNSDCPNESVDDFCAALQCPPTWKAANDPASWPCEAQPTDNDPITYACDDVLVAWTGGIDFGDTFVYDIVSGRIVGITVVPTPHGPCVRGVALPSPCNPSRKSDPCARAVPTCDVLDQTGCMSGQKCSWIEESPTRGRVACVPDGTVRLGGVCASGWPGNTGYDNCMKGLICIAGRCETICSAAPPFAETPPFAGVCTGGRT